MLPQITLRAEAMADPRGRFRGKPTPIAERLIGPGGPGDTGALRGRKLLLLDNGQLAAGIREYGSMFQWLSAHFQKELGAHCSVQAHNLLAMDAERLAHLAGAMVEQGVEAVVIALCHAGVTQPSRVFATELERRGIPSVLICTDLGLPLASATAASYIPGLPLVLARMAAGAADPAAAVSADAFGRAEAEAIAAEVAAGLTTPAAILRQQFDYRFGSAQPARARLVTMGRCASRRP